MFRELGPGARGLLGVVPFFPQGVNEENIDWLFPAISDGPNMFDVFCILSLTYRSNGFITMLAPLRDYLRPKDPVSSPLLGIAKNHYFTRLSARIYPDKPGFGESQWITSEDVNVEHLLDVFTSIDTDSEDAWDACARFMDHLYWHKPRLVMLGPKIEALPDNHPSKVQCLQDLSWLFSSVGNWAENKRILTHTLKLCRERWDDYQVALALGSLSDVNRKMGLRKEGIQEAKEASEIFERLGDTAYRAWSLIHFAWALCDDGQLDAAEEAASGAINLLPEKGQQLLVSRGHCVLGETYASRGKADEAIHHFEVTLEIASSSNLVDQLFWAHFSLARVLSVEGRFDDAHAHIESAKLHAVNDTFHLARVSWLQAWFWDKQHRSEEAKSEALRALDMLEKFGAAKDAEEVRQFLGRADRTLEETDDPSVIPPHLDESDGNGEFLEKALLVACTNCSCCSRPDRITESERRVPQM